MLEEERILPRYEISAYEVVSVVIHIVAADELPPIDLRSKAFVWARVAGPFGKETSDRKLWKRRMGLRASGSDMGRACYRKITPHTKHGGIHETTQVPCQKRSRRSCLSL